MTLADDYARQRARRDLRPVFDALPPLEGRIVLDLGCGEGGDAAELAARGARVIGVDLNEDLLAVARRRGLAGAEFRVGDLRRLDDLGVVADGIWSSFAPAFFPDLTSVLREWAGHLRPQGWIVLIEIDDLFGHEPVDRRTRAALDAYARDAIAAARYDFHMGCKLRRHLERAGFEVAKELTIDDPELSRPGAAPTEVLEAWRRRLDRMKLLRDFCGADYDRLRDDFLACLAREDHRSAAKVCCCIATRP